MESVVQGSFQAPNEVEHQFDMEEGSVEMAAAGASITLVDEHVTPTPETNFGALFKEEMNPYRKKPKVLFSARHAFWNILQCVYIDMFTCSCPPWNPFSGPMVLC
jgi:hypothetical protein